MHAKWDHPSLADALLIPLDKGGWEAIGRGMSAAGGLASDHCFENYRTAQQLPLLLSDTVYGLSVLNKAARRCKGSEFAKGGDLVTWAGINIFFMAEGNCKKPDAVALSWQARPHGLPQRWMVSPGSLTHLLHPISLLSKTRFRPTTSHCRWASRMCHSRPGRCA